MAAIITGKDVMFAKWAAERIATVGNAAEFGPCVAVGIATGHTPEDRLMAVVVFHAFSEKHGVTGLSCAAVDPHWASRETIRAVLSIPFFQYKCNKVYTAIPHTSERVIRFNKAIGFTTEATLKDHFGKGVNAVICRMLARDYDRLYWRRRSVDAKAA